jgi:ABC-type molybdate transport system substrate-binding protein
MNDINSVIQNIIQLKNSGRNPQAILQMMMQSNPQMHQYMAILKNMSNGKSAQEFITQLAKQNGVNEQNMNALSQMFGK